MDVVVSVVLRSLIFISGLVSVLHTSAWAEVVRRAPVRSTSLLSPRVAGGGRELGLFASGRVINSRNVNEIGFSNLVQIGNNAFANGGLAQRDSAGLVTQIDFNRVDFRTGLPVGITDRRTIGQLKEFLGGNIRKLNRNQLSFLQGVGGLSSGIFVVDLTSDLPESVKGREVEAGLAGLNTFLNSIIRSSRRVKVPRSRVRPDGSVVLDLRQFLTAEQLNLLESSDPTRRCTGKTRLAKMLQFGLDSPNYRKLIESPETEAQLDIDRGINLRDKTLLVRNKVYMERGDSGVAPAQRIVSFDVQRRGRARGRLCTKSYDFQRATSSGGAQESQDVTKVGLLARENGGEELCVSPNGLSMDVFLWTAGKRANSTNPADGNKALDEAPASIAVRGGADKEIRLRECFFCHTNGAVFLSGGKQFNAFSHKNYKEKFSSIPRTATNFSSFGTRIRHQDGFTTNANFAQVINPETERLQRLQDQFGMSFVEKGVRQPIMWQIADNFDNKLDMNALQRSLKAPKDVIARVVGTSKGEINRSAFEGVDGSAFCNLKARVASEIAKNPSGIANRANVNDPQALSAQQGDGVTRHINGK